MAHGVAAVVSRTVGAAVPGTHACFAEVLGAVQVVENGAYGLLVLAKPATIF
ncbi:MAG TPA: hypothetical protein VHE30_00325 [Polyangiaceae bacterium]|nr:hypothetical protein [Polyangiaceae bacterium]